MPFPDLGYASQIYKRAYYLGLGLGVAACIWFYAFGCWGGCCKPDSLLYWSAITVIHTQPSFHDLEHIVIHYAPLLSSWYLFLAISGVLEWDP